MIPMVPMGFMTLLVLFEWSLRLQVIWNALKWSSSAAVSALPPSTVSCFILHSS